MDVGAMYIVLGVGVLAWQRWLIAQLKGAERKIPQTRLQHIEALCGAKRVFAAVRTCGIAAIIFGVASLLNI